jgi:2-oxoglutarate dehydrogenase complex dehydrogenase (E1) component-like enzyme
MHIDILAVRQWLQERMERTQNRLELRHEEKIRILTRLTDAVIFEEFLRKKYLGAKTFSLEGGEGLLASNASSQATAMSIMVRFRMWCTPIRRLLP